MIVRKGQSAPSRRRTVNTRVSRLSQRRQILNRVLHRISLPPEYNVNREIIGLANGFRGALPPIKLPPPQSLTGSTTFPNIPVYAISIRDDRGSAFKSRLPMGIIWPGTRGRVTTNKVSVSGALRPGEVGCYDSHYRLWQHIVTSQHPLTLICEDDVNLTTSAEQCQYLNTLLLELKNVPFDCLFLSWFRPDSHGAARTSPHTKKQWTFCQLWAYIVTLEGAQKMINDPLLRNMNEPVDVALFSAANRGSLRNLVAYPPLCLTVGSRSDTAH